MNDDKMTPLQFWAGVIISVFFLAVIILRRLFPSLKIVDTDLVLMVLAVLPWLTLFFKKIRIPGVLEGETHDRSQGSTEKPPPPRQFERVPAVAEDVSSDARKILATLWRYQKQHFKEDYSKRWTFAVFPSAPAYSSYLSGLAELLKRGMVVVSPQNQQCMLTNEGIAFIQRHPEIQNDEDIYTF